MKRFLIFLTMTAFILAAGTSWSKDWTKVRIGVEGAYPPFSYTEPDGTLAGFDIDIAKALGESYGR